MLSHVIDTKHHTHVIAEIDMRKDRKDHINNIL